MGTEIVFVLILPVTSICLLFAAFYWSRVATIASRTGSGPLRSYGILFVGFGVAVSGLSILTYIDSYASFTWLIEKGYYTEAQRSMYLPRKALGEALLKSVFVLPIVSFVVVPLTVWLIKKGRLTVMNVGLFAIFGWFVLSIVAWAINAAIFKSPYSFISFLGPTVAPVALYGLPIPIAAIWLLPSKSPS